MVLARQRNLTFIAGSGTELILSDAKTFDIGNAEMKPHFKNGDYATGIMNGLDVIGEIFAENDELYASSERITNFGFLGIIFSVYLFFLAIHIFLYVITIIRTLNKDDLHEKYKLLKKRHRPYKMYVLPIPFAFLHQLNKKLLDKWRNTIRFAEGTGEIMHKLQEDEEDEFLSKGQITEEKIRSIDYDVWVTSDHTEILILDYYNYKSRHSKCPKCNYKTYFKVYDKTVISATTSSSVRGERKYQCDHFKHSKITTYTIPKIQTSSSGSGGGGGSSSFGGGSSSGGGSSIGW